MALLFSSQHYYITRTAFTLTPPEQPDGNFGQMNWGTSDYLRFGSSLFAAVSLDSAVAFDNPIVSDSGSTPIQLPPNADPPFPPVWPYTWDPSLIYGRENLTQNLRCVRGDTLRFQFTVVQDGGVTDLTGGTLTLTARWSVDLPELFTCTVGDGLTIDDPTSGVVEVSISSTKTSNEIPFHTVPIVYDCEFIDSTGDISTVLYGVITIYPNVTELP